MIGLFDGMVTGSETRKDKRFVLVALGRVIAGVESDEVVEPGTRVLVHGDVQHWDKQTYIRDAVLITGAGSLSDVVGAL